MVDFRESFYKHYVTTFKGYETPADDRFLRSYFAWCRSQYLPFFRDLSKGASILELGCGPGYMMAFLHSEGFNNIRGVDLSEEQIQLARNRDLHVEIADAFTFLEKTADNFDVIMALDFVEHFSKEELLSLMPLICGKLNPDGILILQTPNGQGLFPNQIVYGDFTHITIFSPSSLRQLLRISGFAEIQIKETGPVVKNFIGLFRVVIWQFARLVAMVIRMAETGRQQRIWTENMICCARKE